ncbi:MAG: S-adenosylmethionine:tRNA ribosyltransferase-isomerase, partial [uncultured bacterium]
MHVEYLLSDFDFNLPKELIAQEPSKQRNLSKLIVPFLNMSIYDFDYITNLFDENDVLVINDSKVIKARFNATCLRSKRAHEILFIRDLKDNKWEAIIYNTKHVKVGDVLTLNEDCYFELLTKKGYTNELKIFSKHNFYEVMNSKGEVPLPPYINRDGSDNPLDEERYQTVYAKHPGSSAAPTAGLHFTQDMLTQLENKGVKILKTTLHVGPGTFLPVKTNNLNEHQMHSEHISLAPSVANELNDFLINRKRINAVGSTSLRVLESCFNGQTFFPYEGLTDIFIYPPQTVKSVDRLITNFHLPKSTLFMLVASF